MSRISGARIDELSTWRDKIARRANASAEEVSNLLARTGIRPSPLPATPSRLTVKRIEFTGRKINTQPPARDGMFHFLWDGLSSGPWVMMTDGNLKGKSSVIEIIKWMLRGHPSSILRDDIKRWLQHVSLDFQLGEKHIKVEVAMGEDKLQGNLLQLRENRDESLKLASFSTPNEFQETMSSFFMKELDLEVIQAFREGSEEPATHDWQALSGALFIGTDYKALLGEVVVDGLAGSLLRMYLGLPWISTLSMAKANLKVAEREQARQSTQFVEEQRRFRARLEQIDKELKGKRKRLQSIQSDREVRDKHRESIAEKTRIANQLREVGIQRAVLAAALDEASLAYNEDRRELLRFQEGEAAYAVFRALDPEMCPRCEGHIGEDRRQREKDTNGCSVCGEQLSTQPDDPEELSQILQARVDASHEAHERGQNALQELEDRLKKLQEEEAVIDLECDRLGRILDNGFDEYHDLRAEVRMLEKEQETTVISSERTCQQPAPELAILQAVVKETESQVEGLKNELLNNASQEIVRLAQEFGMTAITSATLRGNASLEVITNGERTTYSKLTGGEQLRLKVATVLAMLKVSEKKGVGRHPGLLFIDSPKNHQMIDEDFKHLLSGLRSAVETLPHLQVFVASTSSAILKQWIGEDDKRIQQAVGEDGLDHRFVHCHPPSRSEQP
ncbi:MAG: hypothetical protein HQL90_05890, partial [Magnetococcales bacterium]|nr:hypothetical protein [Magnetococcales bacterium]